MNNWQDSEYPWNNLLCKSISQPMHAKVNRPVPGSGYFPGPSAILKQSQLLLSDDYIWTTEFMTNVTLYI